MVQREQLAVTAKTFQGLLAVEWVVLAYLSFTLVMMHLFRDELVDPAAMLWGRLRYLVVTVAAIAVYRWRPCRLTHLGRILAQMTFLGWWYPDTYELNRLLPNLDHVFAGMEQYLFGCQPSLLFSEAVPYGWFSELMCLSYVSYFPLIVTVTFYYFCKRYREFDMAAFVILTAFFAYYVIFMLLPVTGPQFYYLAAGTDQIANGVFPDVGDWFRTHSERMAPPGWSDGFWHQMLEMAHDAGERPTAAFPSSHVGITTVLMLLALHSRSRRLAFTVLPFYVLMCFATVYLYAHYAIDVVGGLLTGTAFYLVLRRVYERHLHHGT